MNTKTAERCHFSGLHGGEDQTPFSVKIGITAQTLPTNDEVLVYLSFGVRRWLPARGKLASDHGHSVDLAPTVPYLTGVENSRHFGIARIRRKRVTDADGTSRYAPQWDDRLAPVLAEAGCLDRLPDPQQLADKPLDFLQRHGDAAALVYKTGMLSSEKVGAGLSITDREPLMRRIVAELAPVGGELAAAVGNVSLTGLVRPSIPTAYPVTCSGLCWLCRSRPRCRRAAARGRNRSRW